LTQRVEHYVVVAHACSLLPGLSLTIDGADHALKLDELNAARAEVQLVVNRLNDMESISTCAGKPSGSQLVAACQSLLGLIHGPDIFLGVDAEQDLGVRASCLCGTLDKTRQVLSSGVANAEDLDLGALAEQALKSHAEKLDAFAKIFASFQLDANAHAADAVSRVNEQQTECERVREVLSLNPADSLEKVETSLGKWKAAFDERATALELLAKAELGGPDDNAVNQGNAASPDAEGDASSSETASGNLVEQVSHAIDVSSAWLSCATALTGQKEALNVDLTTMTEKLDLAECFGSQCFVLVRLALDQLGIAHDGVEGDAAGAETLIQRLNERLTNRDPWGEMIRSSLTNALAVWADVARELEALDEGAALSRVLELDSIHQGLVELGARLKAYYGCSADTEPARTRSLWEDVLEGTLLDNFGGQVFQAADFLDRVCGDEPSLVRLAVLLQTAGVGLRAMYALDPQLKLQTARILDIFPKEPEDVEVSFRPPQHYFDLMKYQALKPRLEKLKRATDIPEEGPVVAIKHMGWQRGGEGRKLATILYSPAEWREVQI